MKVIRLISLAAASLLALSPLLAGAQSIPAPAGSVYSGASAVVGIAPVDLSGLQNQINSVASTANAAYNYGTTAYNTANYAVSVASSGWTTGKIVAGGVTAQVLVPGVGWMTEAGVCVAGFGAWAFGYYVGSNPCPGGSGFQATQYYAPMGY